MKIGNQARPAIFDLAIHKPEVLYDQVIEVDERVTLVGYTSDPQAAKHAVQFSSMARDAHVTQPYTGRDRPPSVGAPGAPYVAPDVVRGVSGDAVAILRRPDEATVRSQLEALYQQGYRSLAIVFMFSYTYPEHELLVKRIAQDIGFPSISVSSELMPMIKMVPRATSATADAYLTPVLQAYLHGFFQGFDASLRDGSAGTRVEFMMSDGGLTSVEHFTGLKSIISGPAGGVVGMALTTYDAKDGRPCIGFDMGGTSTDVSRYAGQYERVMETTIDGVTIQSPQLEYVYRTHPVSIPWRRAARRASFSGMASLSWAQKALQPIPVLRATAKAARWPSQMPISSQDASRPICFPRSLARTRTRVSIWTHRSAPSRR